MMRPVSRKPCPRLLSEPRQRRQAIAVGFSPRKYSAPEPAASAAKERALSPLTRLMHLMLAGFSALLVLLFASCSKDRSERFPPYDNTAEVQAYYDSRPEFFKTADPSTIPADLKWENGIDEPEIGSLNAKKGGTLHWFSVEFPSCIRHVGPTGNNAFR